MVYNINQSYKECVFSSLLFPIHLLITSLVAFFLFAFSIVFFLFSLTLSEQTEQRPNYCKIMILLGLNAELKTIYLHFLLSYLPVFAVIYLPALFTVHTVLLDTSVSLHVWNRPILKPYFTPNVSALSVVKVSFYQLCAWGNSRPWEQWWVTPDSLFFFTHTLSVYHTVSLTFYC